jgi:hypothetical protein
VRWSSGTSRGPRLWADCLNAKRWDGRPQKERDEHAAAILVMLVRAAVTARFDTGVWEPVAKRGSEGT